MYTEPTFAALEMLRLCAICSIYAARPSGASKPTLAKDTRLHPPSNHIQRVRHCLRHKSGDGTEAQHELDWQPRRRSAIRYDQVLPVPLL